MTNRTLTVSRLRNDETLLFYIEYAGQISSLFVARNQSIPPHLCIPLQVVTVTCIRNPVTGTVAGLIFACGWKSKELRGYPVVYTCGSMTHSNNKLDSKHIEL